MWHILAFLLEKFRHSGSKSICDLFLVDIKLGSHVHYTQTHTDVHLLSAYRPGFVTHTPHSHIDTEADASNSFSVSYPLSALCTCTHCLSWNVVVNLRLNLGPLGHVTHHITFSILSPNYIHINPRHKVIYKFSHRLYSY